jgi:3-hydroxybutyryl-CoA dehydratase
MAAELHFEELELGYEIPPRSKAIDQEKITRNAEASLDYNPIHIDPEYCRKINLLGKGTTIAHGMMTLSFMGKIVTDWVYPAGGYLKSLEGKFTAPVRPGDEMTVRAVVTEKHYAANKEDNFVVLDIWCENQDKTRVSIGKASAVIPG